MLNNEDDDSDDGGFVGGGTFFENQLLLESAEQSTTTTAAAPLPLKPVGVGHCLAHLASERHAGAGTVKGVRDILVLFVSAHPCQEISAAMLKQCRRFCDDFSTSSSTSKDPAAAQLQSVLCRIRHQRLAVLSSNYQDGEAFQYLGTALMEYAELATMQQQQQDQREQILRSAWQCFQLAATRTPCDARVYNNLGIVLGKLLDENHLNPRQLQQQTRRSLPTRIGAAASVRKQQGVMWLRIWICCL